MNNKIENKQITLEKIQEVAEYLEDCKVEYEKKFEIENKKNKDLEYIEREYEYGKGVVNIRYEIEDEKGKNMRQDNDYEWFISYFNQSQNIKYIRLNLSISFDTKRRGVPDILYNGIHVWVEFSEKKVSIDVSTTNQESEAHRINNDLVNILNNSEERWNSTIKNRKLRIQSFCISVGIILSYLIFIILKVNMNKIPDGLVSYINTKWFIVIGQWVAAISVGNIVSNWFINNIYKTIIPEQRYKGYNAKNKSDDVEQFVQEAEVHFGKYWDAGIRRNKIEHIYKICKKIILIQVVISVILFFILQ